MERIAISAVAAESYVEALGIIQNILLFISEVVQNDQALFLEHQVDPEWQAYRERVMVIFS